VPKYLVELYLPREGAGGPSPTARRARSVAEEMTREGTAVRYLRSIFVPEDETWFCLYEAASAEAAAEASRRSGLPGTRIVEALDC
jgi:hypothetical protein